MEAIERFFAEYGIVVVFVAVMLENAGIPLPGETVLLVAGYYASTGEFDLLMVMAVAAAGAIFGDNAGYWIGRTAGRPLIDRFGRWILLTPERVARIQAYFARHGDKTILVARFITGLRVFAALFAGISHMRWPVFLLYNAAGAVLWSVAVSLLGYLFGASLPILQQWIGRTGLIILGLIVVGILVSLWLRRRVRPSPPPPGSEPG